MHLISKVLGKRQIPFKRGHWVSGEYQQLGASSDPLRGALILSHGISWTMACLFHPGCFRTSIEAAAARPFIELMSLRDILSILHTSENTFSSKKRDWFGTKTAAHHPSNNSLELYPIYTFIPVLDLLQLRFKSAAGCPVICRIFQMKI